MHDDDMPAPPSPYAEILAANIRAERARAGLSQASVARRMKDLGYRWHFQTVGAVERGERRLAAEEVVALSLVLMTPLDALTLPADDGQYVVLPGGQWLVLSPRRRPASHADWASAWDGDKSRLSSKPMDDGEEG